MEYVEKGLSRPNFCALVVWAFIGQIGSLDHNGPDSMLSQTRAEEWQFYKVLNEVLTGMGIDSSPAVRAVQALKLITARPDWYETASRQTTSEIISDWFSLPDIQSFLHCNRFEGILWYNREAFDSLLWWMTTGALLQARSDPRATENQALETLIGCHEIVRSLQKADKNSEYQVEKLLEAAKK